MSVAARLADDPARAARLVALAVPAALLAAVYTAQYGFGLYPCELCWWQRYAQFAALGLGLIGLVRPSRALTALAALAILVSGLTGAYHAGIEYRWWPGLTECSATIAAGVDPLAAIMSAPVIRCDDVQWSMLGISLAGYNFLVSTGAAALILALLARGLRRRA